jgi:hypothetical protein
MLKQLLAGAAAGAAATVPMTIFWEAMHTRFRESLRGRSLRAKSPRRSR